MSNRIIQVINDGVVTSYDINQVNFSIKSGIRGRKHHNIDDIKIQDIDTNNLLEQGFTMKQIYNKRHYEKRKQKKKEMMKEILFKNAENEE